jgi:hypothetical protein
MIRLASRGGHSVGIVPLRTKGHGVCHTIRLRRRMPSSVMWSRKGFARTDVSEEGAALIFRVERLTVLGTTLAITIRYSLLVNIDVPCSLILSTLMMEAIHSSETSVLTRPTLYHIKEDGILHSYRCERLKSYKITLPLQRLGFKCGDLFSTQVPNISR